MTRPATDLPIEAVVPRLLADLAGAGSAVLVSPPGTGKTTVVPLALADAVDGRVVVAEPRRVAARAAARRMAWLLGEDVGGQVGYTVRGERRPGRRVEVVTTGVLVQRLQRDPELPGVGAVVLDECHERHLDTDLALAFCVETRAALRPDLQLLATSATADAQRLAALLAGPVIGADAPLYPVATVWAPSGPVDLPRGLRVDPRFLDHVAAVVRRALGETDGDVLVFLPGAAEIDAVAGRLSGVDVFRLHGRLEASQQDAVLRPSPTRRVVLASAVAESSLTVPGVRVVVDAGLARVPRLDLSRGLGALVTVPVSRSSAHQRAGRAGREAPGVAYRCWSEADHARRPEHPEPELATADLTGFALALARWGDPDGTRTALLEPPPPAAMAVARQTLQALGAVDADGRITARGTAFAGLGVHPRLARALLDGGPLVGSRRAAELVALLADDTLGGGTDDLAAARRRARSAATPRWRSEVDRLRTGSSIGDHPPTGVPDDLAAGIVAGFAYPERLAKARSGGYLMALGTAAELAPGTALSGAGWLAIAEATRQPGSPSARIRSAAVIDEATAREAGAALLTRDREVHWDGDVVAREVERLGAITLFERPIRNAPRALVEAALREGLRREGLDLLRWTPAASSLRARLAFARSALGEPWPDVTDAGLLERADEWLGPELARANRRADLASADTATALRRLLGYREAARLEEVAPERLAVPSGSRVRVTYSEHWDAPETPFLAVKLQETFGLAATPRIGDGRVPVVLHLLSPAGRPLAVTADLASFWRTGYPAVRGEMRGRYPRHPWPEDPATAVPTARTKPRQ